ncbi:scavenger receptor class F member 1-like [Haliotis rubra]|uniref:scavenger receptor class F member 1-like n=1 Tax=Haliotis rubra TaxID=36100 RepID=UPI001EE5253E|nr:scavenger receptor class F member 1-like [Haliotis rubra]
MAILSMDMRGRWFWQMMALVNVICSQQLCPESCLQCDKYLTCLRCVDGYYGQRCNLACDPACRNGRCSIDGSCDDNIENADRKMGRVRRQTRANCHDTACTCCVSNYRGTNCQVPCPNCRTRYVSGVCNNYCETGFHGDTCENICPQNCALGNAGKPLCKQATGECSNNCKIGFFGTMCNKPCPSGCKNDFCLPERGSCDECNDKRYGEKCEKDCHTCKDSCYKNGTCVGGCKDGYYGKLCNLRCGTPDCSKGSMCQLYKVDQPNICFTPCRYVPESQNVTEDCVAVQQPVQHSSNAGTIAGIGVGIGIPVIAGIVGIAVLICFLRRRNLCCWRGSNVAQNGDSLASTENSCIVRIAPDVTGTVGKAPDETTSEDKTVGNKSDDQDVPLLSEGGSNVAKEDDSTVTREKSGTVGKAPDETTSEDKTTGNNSDDQEEPLLSEGGSNVAKEDDSTVTREKSGTVPTSPGETTMGSNSEGPKKPPRLKKTSENKTMGGNTDGPKQNLASSGDEKDNDQEPDGIREGFVSEMKMKFEENK